MKIILNYEIASDFKASTDLEVLPLRPYGRLLQPVRSHADMLVCIIENTVFSYSDYIDENSAVFEYIQDRGYKLVRCTPPLCQEYPNDIGLNVAIVGKRLFCNEKFTAKEIREYASEKGIEIINVKQGYTACSTLVLDESNVITADLTIKRAMEGVGINVLFIDEENIRLPGYNNGFIGGAGVVVGRDVYFFGDAKNLRAYDKISTLIHSLGMGEFSISSGEVFDFGGGKVI